MDKGPCQNPTVLAPDLGLPGLWEVNFCCLEATWRVVFLLDSPSPLRHLPRVAEKTKKCGWRRPWGWPSSRQTWRCDPFCRHLGLSERGSAPLWGAADGGGPGSWSKAGSWTAGLGLGCWGGRVPKIAPSSTYLHLRACRAGLQSPVTCHSPYSSDNSPKQGKVSLFFGSVTENEPIPLIVIQTSVQVPALSVTSCVILCVSLTARSPVLSLVQWRD